MSLKLLSIEFKRDFTHPKLKQTITGSYVAILKTMAQSGQDSKDGKYITSIFLSQDSISRKTSFSRPTIQRALNCFEKLGVLDFVKKRIHGINEYCINLEKLNEFLDVKADLNPKVSKLTSVRNSAASFGRSAASSCNTDPFKDPFYKYSGNKNKKEIELNQISSASFIPIDQVREESKVDPHKVFTAEEKATGSKFLEEMLKGLPKMGIYLNA